METMTLDQLTVLVAVADAGSFTGAGRALRRAQSGVSYAIGQLEESLGVTLFDRSTRTPRFTEAGRAVLADARQVLERVAALRGRARALSAGVEPEVTLAVDPMLPLSALTMVATVFRDRWPGVTLRVYTEALGGVAARVRAGSARLGVTAGFGVSGEALAVEPLAQVRLRAVAAAGTALAAAAMGGAAPDAAFSEVVQIVLTDPTEATRGVEVNVLSRCTWRVAELATKRALIVAGLGWGTLPEHLAAEDIAAGRLVEVTPASWGPAPKLVPLWSLTRVDAPPGPAGSWLRDELHIACAGASLARM